MTEASPERWLIERYDRAVHDRTTFDCGESSLNDWIKRRVSQYEKRDLARTYVAVGHGNSVVLGYHAMSSHRVTFDALPADESKGLPKGDIPVVLLGRLAVDRTVRGRGLGKLLLIDALRRAEFMASRLGIRAVEVDAVDDTARNFYLKYGFTPLVDDPNHLFLPMRVIRQLGLRPLAPEVPDSGDDWAT